MRQSTDYAIGGTGFGCAGAGMIGSAVLGLYYGTMPLGNSLVFAFIGTLFVSIGVHWVWQAQQFYREEETAKSAPPPPGLTAR